MNFSLQYPCLLSGLGEIRYEKSEYNIFTHWEFPKNRIRKSRTFLTNVI
jgi:hypothetical protein